MKISIRPVVSYEPIIRALARFILAANVLLIVFAALFPFDFDFPSGGIDRWLYEIRIKFDSSPEPAVLADKVQNFLFFVPFGFGLAASIRSRRPATPALRLVAAGILGFALSLTVEVLQVFLGFRDPTWLDVLMNTLGAVAGAGIVVFAGEQILQPIAQQLAKLKPYATFRNVALVLGAYTLLQFALPWRAMNRGSLDSWDVNFPLVVGNEAGGGREWLGSVMQVDLAARAATPEEVVAIAAAGSAREVLAEDLLGSWETIGDAPYPDATGRLRPLAWSKPPALDDELTPPPATYPAVAPPRPPSTQPARITHDRWLHTHASIAPATMRIRNTSQFTLATTIAPHDAHQQGPARIVSISGGVYRRNFSLMQVNRDLSLRLRTPLMGEDGSAPEALIEDVFETSNPMHIVITYQNPLLICYIDGAERGRMEITPEAEFIWRLYPRSGWRVQLGAYGFRSYAIVYRLLVFIPFAALLAAITALSGKPVRIQLAIIAAAIVGVALVLELIMGQLTASGFQPRNLLISLIIPSVSIAAMRLRRTTPAHSRRSIYR